MAFFQFIKRQKVFYYIKNGFLDVLPRSLFQKKINSWLYLQNNYPKEVIKNRLDYYCSGNVSTTKNEDLSLINMIKKNHKSMYYYDFMKIARYFNQKYKVNFKFGDVDTNQKKLSFVKSRPINHNGNSVLLPLDAFRHFYFINDTKPYHQKKDEIVWRGVIHKENRKFLVDKFYNQPKMNIGTTHTKNSKPEWIKNYLTIKQQLEYKFILSIEGIDVATNLKWIMSSNSLCFMPKPKFETWYMEGKLIPNFHYVLIKDDYSDVEEKMEFYSKNIPEAEQIIKNAQSWTLQFKDKKLEKLISILVMKNYFEKTNQYN